MAVTMAAFILRGILLHLKIPKTHLNRCSGTWREFISLEFVLGLVNIALATTDTSPAM